MPTLDRSLIAGLPGFAGLPGEALDHILTPARSARFPKDSEVFSQDAEATSFFLLLSGHIRVVRTTPAGDQVIARYINEGELFGIAVAMGRTTYPASAVAAVDCVVLSWPNSAWPDLQSRVPAFGATAYQTIGARLQETQSRVIEMSTQQVEQRIASAVLRLVSQSGRKTSEGIEIDFKIADLIQDGKLLEVARQEALRLIESDPYLRDPQHAGVLEKVQERRSRMAVITVS